MNLNDHTRKELVRIALSIRECAQELADKTLDAQTQAGMLDLLDRRVGELLAVEEPVKDEQFGHSTKGAANVVTSAHMQSRVEQIKTGRHDYVRPE